jgi:guanosine-3',5'-bis(diphosphate) 3'-pyrophosphohydrolase
MVPPPLSSALSFAARAHQGQLRKDGATPYFAHCARVGFTVLREFGCADEDVLCAAVLHDTIEDTTTDYDDLLADFGSEVARIVASLSKDPRLPEEMRERAYFDHLAGCDWKVRLIKLADALDNLRDSGSSAVATKARVKAEKALALGFGDEPALVRARTVLNALLAPA